MAMNQYAGAIGVLANKLNDRLRLLLGKEFEQPSSSGQYLVRLVMEGELQHCFPARRQRGWRFSRVMYRHDDPRRLAAQGFSISSSADHQFLNHCMFPNRVAQYVANTV